MRNRLYYGDNLNVLRQHVGDGTMDLCYIDPPFHSGRDYHHPGDEDIVPARAFTDTWTWDAAAAREYEEIVTAHACVVTPQATALIKGLREMLGEGSLLAYLVSLTLRIAEIQRVLAPRGTFYLHCDPTASHYLKLVCDSIFCARGGEFRNEVIWAYESGGRSKRDFGRKHDVILRYTKSREWAFHADDILLPRATTRHNHMKRGVDADGRAFCSIQSNGKVYKYYADQGVIPSDVWTDGGHLQQRDPERMGYPTQKPEKLLARIIKASSAKGQTVLDAYAGGGTTLVVAQTLARHWVGIDNAPQSIALTRRRLEQAFGAAAMEAVDYCGVPC